MAIEAICLTMPHRPSYRKIAEAMHIGIQACGDHSTLWDLDKGMPPPGDVGVMYGWKRNELLRHYPRFVYGDLAYWRRETYWKINCNAWSPDGYVSAGLHPERWERLGLDIHPVRGCTVQPPPKDRHCRSVGQVVGSARLALHGMGDQVGQEAAGPRLRGGLPA